MLLSRSKRSVGGGRWRDDGSTRLHQRRHTYDVLLVMLLRLMSLTYRTEAAAAAPAASELNVTELDCRMRRLALSHAHYLQPWRLLEDEEDPTFQQVRDALRLDTLCPDFISEQSIASVKTARGEARPESVQRRQRAVKVEDPCARSWCIFVDPAHQRTTAPDVADGSFERPVATASAALELSRRNRINHHKNSAYNTTIIFLQGIHFLSETLQLNADDSGLTLTTLPGEQAWLSGGIEIPSDTHWSWDCSLNLHVRVANLTDLLRDFETRLPKIPSLFSKDKRLIRARYPNGDPELNQWGYNTPDNLQYSIAADQVLVWHKPPPGTIPSFTYVDLRDNSDDPTRPIKNDSTMPLYNVYASGSGGVCADVWGPEANSYWCSNASSGGWAEVDQEAAITGRIQIPIGMSFNTTSDIGRRLRRWKDAAVGGIVHAWHSQSWAMHMFEIESVGEGQFHFAPGGGRQGGRNWCRCDQCTYAGPWCGQHQTPRNDTDDRLISGTWMVENVLVELDEPGEYFFDPTSRQLFVYPNITGNDAKSDDSTIGLQDLRFALLESLIRIHGARDITISGLGFRDTAATYMSSWSAPSGGDWSLHRDGALFVEDAENIVVRSCMFRRLDGNAVFLSKRTRNVTVTRNVFEWLGESAIATWGDTNDFDGSAGNFPLGTVIEGNVMRELGIYEKQSSGVAHNKAAQTIIRNNIIFNVPRAAINFNDMLGGGDIVENNLVFNSCRESGDHGPINSWDRQPFLTSLGTGSPSFVPIRRTIASNLIFASYGASQGVDNDDGSSWFHIHHNVFYDADGFKMDYGGHDSVFEHNLVVRYPAKRTQGRPCVDLSGSFLPGHGHVVRWNTCLVPTNDVPIIQLESCTDTNAVLHNNVYMAPHANASVACGYQSSPIPFEEFQVAYGIESGSTLQQPPQCAIDVVKMSSAVLYPEERANIDLGKSRNHKFVPS